MAAMDRPEQIVALVQARGFLSVKELSKLCGVSEMTIRRDLQRLDEEHRLQRTYGGATPLWPCPPPPGAAAAPAQPEGFWIDTIDVLVATSVSPRFDKVLLDRAAKRSVPIVAESLAMPNAETVVAVDNFQAGMALGRWAGDYAQRHWAGRVCALDLSFELANTQARSQGFIAGLREVQPAAQLVLSINAQSRYESAYRLTADALTVHPEINVIFAINDTMAWGAINACQDLARDPDSLAVLTFGLEGDTLKDALVAGSYCRAGLAMFPEIVGPACVEVAIAAYNHQPLARQLVMPHAILTPETLLEFYEHTESGWRIRWPAVKARLSIPLDIDRTAPAPAKPYPKRIGFIVPFGEHEWYRNLTACMSAHAALLRIDLEIVDAEQNLKSETAQRRRGIARAAAEQVQPGDAILIDCGETATYLAEELAGTPDVTVITNSLPVFDALKDYPDITLISTGGHLRHATDCLIGPTAENALRELRADKLFLVVTGFSLGFGLSHTNLAEVAMKQAMLHAARQVILLADHTIFGQESVVQVAPATAVHKLITDEALPASVRLDLTKLGIEVITVRM